MSMREDYQRARSAAEKQDRRQTIIAAAERMFAKAGPDEVTMSAVAAEVGIAKGTLYSYFKTKEELLLVIYTEVFATFCARVKKGLRKGMSDAAFLKLVYRAAFEDPRVLSLGVILSSVIERNVPPEAFAAGKRAMTASSLEFAEAVEAKLNLKEGQGALVFRSLSLILLGAVQHDITPYVDRRSLPADVLEIIDAGTAEKAFFPAAELVMKGLRAH